MVFVVPLELTCALVAMQEVAAAVDGDLYDVTKCGMYKFAGAVHPTKGVVCPVSVTCKRTGFTLLDVPEDASTKSVMSSFKRMISVVRDRVQELWTDVPGDTVRTEERTSSELDQRWSTETERGVSQRRCASHMAYHVEQLKRVSSGGEGVPRPAERRTGGGARQRNPVRSEPDCPGK
jgi:hypothetical protein